MNKNVYICNICNKNYKYRQSLSRHRVTKHPHFSSKKTENSSILLNFPQFSLKNPQFNINKNECEYCLKIFSRKDNLKRHLLICKVKIENNKKNLEFENIKEEIKEQLMDIIKKECKMHPKTLQKINKQLTQQTVNGDINNGTINNITNNYNIIQFGNENLLDLLTKKEQIMILDKKHQSLNHLIEYVHFNDKFPQFKNIAITNLKDNLAHMYDKTKNKFIAIKKDELLNTVIEMRMLDIEEFYNNNEDNLNKNTKKNIKKFLEKMTNDEPYFNYKKEDIKLLLYNNNKNDLLFL